MNEYWLIFKPGTHWITKVCKKRFGHISIITKDEFEWMRIDPHVDRLRFEIMDADIKNDVIMAHKKVGYKCIYLRTNPHVKRSFLSFIRLATCVEMIKYCTGIKFRAWTPYGLYKKLCKMAFRQKYPKGVECIKVLI